MSECVEAAGGIAEGALLARAVEPRAGEDDGHTHETECLNCGTTLVGPHCHACGQRGHVHKTLGAFPVPTGSAQFPLPIGDWKVTGVQQDPVWHFDPKLIAGSKKTDKEADVPAGPNNPVGVVWVGLTKEHYGIHGTPHPERIGKTESNGCIRMTNWSVLALSKVVSDGMQVTMRE